MGVIISYEGRIDDQAQMGELILDATRYSVANGWKYQEVDDRITGHAYFPSGKNTQRSGRAGQATVSVGLRLKEIDEWIRGVIMRPHGTESLALKFNREGEIMDYSPIPGKMYNDPNDPSGNLMFTSEPGYYQEIPGNWVKTTGAVESHLRIIGLLRYLQQHYINNLEVTDSSHYWETLDVEKLRRDHSSMQAIINSFSDPAQARSLLAMIGLKEIESFEGLTTEKPPPTLGGRLH